jgi:hypothetical protein
MLDAGREITFFQELEIGFRRNDKSWWDGEFGPSHLAKVCTFSSDDSDIIFSNFVKPIQEMCSLGH